jgi:hypothetical protein
VREAAGRPGNLAPVNPQFRKVALIAASLGLLVSLFLALRPDDEDDAGGTTSIATTAPATTETEPPATGTEPPAETEDLEPPTTIETQPATDAPTPDGPVTIRIAVPSDTAPRVRTYSVRRGREVEIVVRTELTDHVHLHGYDLTADVGPGRPGRIEFTADAAGIFEIELEERGLHIAELEVRP